MLPNKYMKLISGYLDGELNPRQRKILMKLLRKSPRARKLLRLMREDSQKLTSLSHTHLPNEFPLKIMREIVQLNTQQAETTPAPVALPAPTPTESAPLPVAKPWYAASWAMMTMAAALFLAVTAASYVFFRINTPQNNVPPVVKNDNKQQQPTPQPKANQDLLRFALADLPAKKHREKLATELGKNTSFEMKLLCSNEKKAVAKLQKVFKQNGLKILVDEQSDKNLNKGKVKRLVIVAEEVQPYDVSQILIDLSQENSSVHTVALNPLNITQREEIAQVMGLDAEQFQPAKKSAGELEKGELPKDPLIPTSNGKKPKGKSGKTTSPTQPVAVAMVTNNGELSQSEAIRQYLKTRNSQPRDGTLQMVFVLEVQTV